MLDCNLPQERDGNCKQQNAGGQGCTQWQQGRGAESDPHHLNYPFQLGASPTFYHFTWHPSVPPPPEPSLSKSMEGMRAALGAVADLHWASWDVIGEGGGSVWAAGAGAGGQASDLTVGK